jgi:hypothetical protein
MATNINFYLNSTLVNPPLNWQQIDIELNFDKDKANLQGQTSITEWIWVNENAEFINQWLEDGKTTGVGVLEGIPLTIDVERSGVVENVFTGYLDLTTCLFGTNRCSVKAIKTNGIDWLNDVADGFTLDYLKDIGLITSSDYQYMPYIINSVPNYVEAAVSVLGVYVMVKEIKTAIQRILDFVVEIPIYYVFSTYIKLILYIIYLILLIIALIKLVKAIILLIIQPVKYHACMSIKSQLEKGASYLEMTFESPILNEAPYNNAYILPQKYFNPINKKEKQLFGFTEPSITQEGFYKGTFGNLLRECKKLFNAKVMIVGNKIMLVRDDYSTSTNIYTLNRPSNNYDYRHPTFNVNTDQFRANYLISFQTDSVDKNTIQDYLGTSYQVILEPLRVNNTNMRLMKGLEEIRLEFALAKRKNDLTVPENILNEFLKIFDVIAGALVKVVNAIITVLNKIIALVNNILKKLASIGIKMNFKLPEIPKVDMPNFKSIFANRIGMLKIETDIISVPKIFIMNVAGASKNNKIDVANDQYFSGKYIYNNFHFINSFVPSSEKPNANQYYLESFEKVPFSFAEYEQVKENNSIFTDDGEDAIVDSLKWNVFNQTADLKIRINRLYTNNLKETFLEPNGK